MTSAPENLDHRSYGMSYGIMSRAAAIVALNPEDQREYQRQRGQDFGEQLPRHVWHRLFRGGR
jgi:hypothetical protein